MSERRRNTTNKQWIVWVYYHHAQQYLSYMVVVSFIQERTTGVPQNNTDLTQVSGKTTSHKVVSRIHRH